MPATDSKHIHRERASQKKKTIGIITQCRCLKRLIGQFFFCVVCMSLFVMALPAKNQSNGRCDTMCDPTTAQKINIINIEILKWSFFFVALLSHSEWICFHVCFSMSSFISKRLMTLIGSFAQNSSHVIFQLNNSAIGFSINVCLFICVFVCG